MSLKTACPHKAASYCHTFLSSNKPIIVPLSFPGRGLRRRSLPMKWLVRIFPRKKTAVSWLISALVPGASGLVRALAGDPILCSWARHFPLTVPLSTQEYKWVPANCWGNLTNWGRGSDLWWTSIPPGVSCDQEFFVFFEREKEKREGMIAGYAQRE